MCSFADVIKHCCIWKVERFNDELGHPDRAHSHPSHEPCQLKDCITGVNPDWKSQCCRPQEKHNKASALPKVTDPLFPTFLIDVQKRSHILDARFNYVVMKIKLQSWTLR